MSDVLNNDDLNALAAEYVLGTLDYEERKGASSLLEVDHAFRGLVRIWERRFGELHLMVEPVNPDRPVWERVKAKVVSESPSATFAPPETSEPVAEASPPADANPPSDTAKSEAEVEAPPVAPAAPSSETVAEAPSISPEAEPAAEPGAISPTANLIRELEEAEKLVEAAQPTPAVTPPRRLIERDAVVSDEPAKKAPRRRRGLGLLAVTMSLIAIVLASLIGAWRFAPQWLPPELSATSLLLLPKPEPPPLPPPRKPRPPDFDE
jgi:hypothetical protein